MFKPFTPLAQPLKKAGLALLASSTLLVAHPALADLNSNLKHTPTQADTLFSLSTDYKDWEYFLTRKPFAEMFADFKADIAPDLEQELGVSFEQDLLPMLGSHLTVAIYQKEMVNNKDFPLLMAFDLKDPSGYSKIIAKLKETASKDTEKKLREESYNGVTLYGFEGKNKANGVPYLALSGNTLLFGAHNLIKKGIDSAKSNQGSMLADSAFGVSKGALEKEKFWVYVNPQSLGKLMAMAPVKAGSAEAKEMQEAQKSVREALELYDSLGLSLDLNRNGLVLKSVVRVKNQGLPAAKQAYANDFVKLWNTAATPLRSYVQSSPARPLLFFGLDGLQLMERSFKLFPQDKDTQMMMAMAEKGFQQFTGLNFKKDLLPYSDGRASLAVFYPDDTEVFDRPPHVLLMMGSNNNAAILKNLNQKLKFDLSALEDEGPKGPKTPKESLQIQFPKKANLVYQGVPMYVALENDLIKEFKQSIFVQPGFANIGNQWLFASNPEALKAGIDLVKGKRNNLTSNYAYNQVRERYGIEEKGGLMYMDLRSLIKMGEFLTGGDEEVGAFKPTLEAFRSVMMGGKYNKNVAEGVFVLDVNMDKVDFELLGAFLGKPVEGELEFQIENQLEE